MRKVLVSAVILLMATGLATAQPSEDDGFLEEEEVIDLEEAKEELLDEAPGPARYLVAVIERIIPEVRADIQIHGEFSDEFVTALAEEDGLDDLGEEKDAVREVLNEKLLPENRSASIKLDDSLEELKISPEKLEDPNIQVSIHVVAIEDMMMDDIEGPVEMRDKVGKHVEEGNIEYEVSGARNRFIFTLVETVLL